MAEPAAASGRRAAVMLWLWVLGMLGAYLWQFRDLADPILAVLRGG
jgi:hypothetical protein